MFFCIFFASTDFWCQSNGVILQRFSSNRHDFGIKTHDFFNKHIKNLRISKKISTFARNFACDTNKPWQI